MYYRGFGARLCAIVPMRLTFWGVQDVANTQLQTYTALAPATIGLCSGVVAGCAQTVVDAPTEWLKIQRITNSAQSSFTYSYAIKALLTYKHIPGFYPTLYRNVIVVCCLNTGLLCYGNISQHSTSPDNNIPGGNPYSTYFTVSVLSSLIGSIISHPFDVLKTSMQRANAPPRDTMFSLFRQYAQTNQLSLWTGVVPRCTHVMCETTQCAYMLYVNAIDGLFAGGGWGRMNADAIAIINIRRSKKEPGGCCIHLSQRERGSA